MLKFSPEKAKWVANESWHPNQKGKYLSDGWYELIVPFSDQTEILMDIMKYGSDAIVLAPKQLVEAIKNNLIINLAHY